MPALAVGLATATVLSAVGLAAAAASTSSPHPGNGPASSAGAPSHQRLLTANRRAELTSTGHTTVVRHTRAHGELTLLVQVGRITSTAPDSITVTSKGGYVHSYAVTAATRIRAQRQQVAAATLEDGDRVLVVASSDGRARRIALRSARDRAMYAAKTAGKDRHSTFDRPDS